MTERMADIVVGLDFSPDAQAALIQAMRLARRQEAKLHVMYVVDRLPVTSIPDFATLAIPHLQTELSQRAEARLADAVRSAAAELADLDAGPDGDVEVHAQVLVGSPFVELVMKSNELAANLLVLGAHGENEKRHRAGVLATRCVRKAAAPVMLVRRQHHEAFKTIACCVDYSDPSRRAMDQAIRMAITDRAELHVVHVVSPPWQYPEFASLPRVNAPEFQRSYKKVFEEELAAFVEGYREELNGVFVRTAIIEHVSPPRGIVEYLERCGADLAVLGTRGRTGLNRLLMGTTAERIIHDSPCSILAIKPEGFAYASPRVIVGVELREF